MRSLFCFEQVINLKKLGLDSNCITVGPSLLSKCTRAHVNPPWYVRDRLNEKMPLNTDKAFPQSE